MSDLALAPDVRWVRWNLPVGIGHGFLLAEYSGSQMILFTACGGSGHWGLHVGHGRRGRRSVRLVCFPPDGNLGDRFRAGCRIAGSIDLGHVTRRRDLVDLVNQYAQDPWEVHDDV